MPRPIPTLLPRPMLALVTAVLVAAGGAAFMSASTAYAEIDGPCEATIAGVPVGPLDSGDRGDDIKVSEHEQVVVTATSTTGFASHKVELEFAGQRWTVSDEEDDGSTSWSDTVNVDDYATWGVGLYKVIGVSTLSNGETCEGAATVDVDGNPLTTVAGGVALGGAVVGTIGAAAVATRGSWSPMNSLEDMLGTAEVVDMVETDFRQTHERVQREREERQDRAFGRLATWLDIACGTMAIVALLLTPLMALTGGGAGGPSEPGTPGQPAGGAPKPAAGPLRVPWRLRISLVGLICGLLAGAGAVVLMQQYSIEYPTLAVVIRTVVVAIIVYGIVLPTVGYTIGWFRANRRIAARERELGLG